MGQTTETNSLEVRWFETGSPPRAVDEWISGLGTVDRSTRTDLYFPPPGPAFKLKLRSEGVDFVELKRRLADPTVHTFAPDVEGNVEQWYKWSFSLDHTPAPWTADRTGLWLPVTKTRTLYTVEEADLRAVDDGIPAADVSVHAEVTAVSAASARAWTCDIEAAGPPGRWRTRSGRRGQHCSKRGLRSPSPPSSLSGTSRGCDDCWRTLGRRRRSSSPRSGSPCATFAGPNINGLYR
jgi:hypothetical protein